MSKFSEVVKDMKSKEEKFFFGDNLRHVSNKYIIFDRVVDNDNILIVTSDIKVIKGNMVLIVGKNQAIYLKDWQVRKVHNYYLSIDAYAVKLNRNYFHPYTFSFEFENYGGNEETFDSLYELAVEQQKENEKWALGHMNY